MTTAALSDRAASPGDVRKTRLFGRSVLRGAILLVLIGVVALTATPALVQYRLMRGRGELARGNHQAALGQFRQAERLQPRNPETQFWLARSQRKLGDIPAAQQHLDRARRLGYPSSERLLRESRLLVAETGRVRDVEAYLPEMLMNSGEDAAEICDTFARGYGINLQPEKALTLLDAWEKDHPDDYRPRFRRGQVHASKALDWSKAEAAFREAQQLAPDRPEVNRELGKALLELRRLEEAEDSVRRALRLNPKDADSLLTLARILKEQGENASASECLRQLLEFDPRNDTAQVLLARVTLDSGDPQGAIRDLVPVIELWPEDLLARYCLAEALRAAGQLDEAKSQFKKYAELEQNSQRLEQLGRLVTRSPFDPELRYEMGLLRMRHLSRAEGVMWLQSVFLYAPDHAGAHTALAEYYNKVGDVNQAQLHQLAARTQSAESLQISPQPEGPTP
jgi:tetratricopeptide (TPR) repeat protein